MQDVEGILIDDVDRLTAPSMKCHGGFLSVSSVSRLNTYPAHINCRLEYPIHITW